MADFEINKRLKKIITEVYKTTPSNFSKKYNDKGGVKTSQVMRERNGLSSKLLNQILIAYPEINKTWLLTGEGEMINKQTNIEYLQESNEAFHKNEIDMLIKNNTMLALSVEKMASSVERMTIVNENLSKTILQLTSKNEAAQEDVKCADAG